MLVNKDKLTRMKEFDRVIKSLSEGEYTRSHIWFLLYRTGTDTSFWSLTNLDAIFYMARSPHTAGNITTLWCESLDMSAEEHITEIHQSGDKTLRQMVETGNLVNLTDLILAITESDTLIAKYPKEITHVCYLAYRMADISLVSQFVPTLQKIKHAFADTLI